MENETLIYKHFGRLVVPYNKELTDVLYLDISIFKVNKENTCLYLSHMLQRVGRWLIFDKGQQKLDVETDDRKKKIRKFKESAWKCIYYLSAEVLALAVSYNEPWFTNTNSFWVGPGDQKWPDQKMK